MTKKFNVNGCCFPDEHYMVDISGKFNQITKLIESDEYFTINRPRQYGKTTILNVLFKKLPQEKYLSIFLSFEGIGDSIFENESTFSPAFVRMFLKELQMTCPDTAKLFLTIMGNVKNLEDLSTSISICTGKINKDVIVIIDEIDKSSNNQLFLSFLGMLRDKYLKRKREATFKSVILAGVHDVKSLKLKIREGHETKLNSPWNIAADFNVDMSFNPAEIKTMLASYAEDKGVKMDFDAISERIYYHTGGHPYLISYLCKIIDDNLNLQKSDDSFKYWKITDIDHASQLIISKCKDISHFINLTEMLKGDLALYRIVASIIFENGYFSYSVHEPILNKGIEHGLFRCNDGRIAIHNPIYNHIIADFMSDYSAKNQQEAPDEKI